MTYSDLPPASLNVDASTHCQLRCATCPTASGLVREGIGSGHLEAASFKRFLEENPSILHVELANWGEVLLNPELAEIAKAGYERDVAITISNGVNFNFAPEPVLEALVKYRVQVITAAIDGADQESYAAYRIRGEFERVIQNIRRLNEIKKAHGSYFPVLIWQFIAFGHNEHGIEDARRLAQELGMHFYVKLAWDDFSPVKNETLIRSVTRSGAASRKEFLEQSGENYLQKALCRQLWNNPQVNFDGEVLGCCANRWSSFGNAFEEGLAPVLAGEKMQYVKRMLMGQAEPREDMPCVHCELFQGMQESNEFMSPDDLMDPVRKYLRYPPARWLGKALTWGLNRSRRFGNWVVRPIADACIKRALH